jgi:ribosomal protein S6--L-glutamate ligase
MYQQKKIIGSEEWIRIPELNIPAVKARIDSGAKTSTLHAYNMQTFEDNGKEYVRFDVHPVQHNRRISVRCKAELVGRRVIKSSSGDRQRRYVIKTPITLGGETWDIEVTLTNRDNMGYRMLIGREAMRGRYIVDPEQKFIFGNLSIDADKLYMVTKRPRKSLRIAVLASNPELYSNRRIIEAGVTRGHEMIFVNIRQCYINVSSENPAVHYRGGETLHDIDAVIPRIRPSVTSYGCAVLRHFEHLGAYCLNDAISISRSRDKLRSLQLLVNKGIDIPITGFADSPEDTNDIVELVGGAPLIVKLLEGTQGKGVVLAQTDKAAESVINAFKSLKANILVQAFVKEAEGRDLRLFVVDGKVIGSMERVAAEGEFRANVHLGGKAREVKTTPAERKIAIKASKVMGLKVAGVDIIRSRSGPKVLEVNSSPGLEGIEGVTHKDIAGEMIDAIERHLL